MSSDVSKKNKYKVSSTEYRYSTSDISNITIFVTVDKKLTFFFANRCIPTKTNNSILLTIS